MKYGKYLPIGTVVLLKNGKKRVMITGFCYIDENKKIWDYCSCIYPEGNINSSDILVFDHNQIEKIYYIGFNDNEYKKYNEKLIKLENMAEKIIKTNIKGE